MASKTTSKTTRKPAAKPVAKATPEAPKVDLHALILATLKEQHGLNPVVKWAPSGNYCSLYLVKGKSKQNIGYVFKQTSRGVRVEPAATLADLPKTVKGFVKGTRSERFALVGVAKDAGGAVHAAAALAAAAAKLDAAPAPSKADKAKAARVAAKVKGAQVAAEMAEAAKTAEVA